MTHSHTFQCEEESLNLSPTRLADNCFVEISMMGGIHGNRFEFLSRKSNVSHQSVIVIVVFQETYLPPTLHVFLGFFCLGSLVTLIRHPSELMNVPLHQQQNKCRTLVKNKTAAATTALQFTYPLFTANSCSTSGNSHLSQTQVGKMICEALLFCVKWINCILVRSQGFFFLSLSSITC